MFVLKVSGQNALFSSQKMGVLDKAAGETVVNVHGTHTPLTMLLLYATFPSLPSGSRSVNIQPTYTCMHA